MGDFKFTITTANLIAFGSGGPGFNNRVLTSGGGVVNGNSSAGFTVTINAEYTGAYPPPDLKDPAFSLAIDQISIWAMKYPSYGTTNEAYWTETTAGHGGVSPSVFLTEATDITDATNYKQIIWNPGDWEINGTNIIRTFQLPTGVNYFPAIDGLEIIGHGVLFADVPEPSAFALIAMGGLSLAYWWRRRRN